MDSLGTVELIEGDKTLIIRSVIHFYGTGADAILGEQVARDIEEIWNEPTASIFLSKKWYQIQFYIEPVFSPHLTPEDVIENTDPGNNYFRIEDFASGNISYVDGIGSNTGYFLKANLLNHSTTAAHEYGHSLGLYHPQNLDIRGQGVPGLMYPRGTLVDPEYQYDPSAPAGTNGGTLNPFTRKVLLTDIENLNLDKLELKENRAVLGEFTSIWHDAEMPANL